MSSALTISGLMVRDFISFAVHHHGDNAAACSGGKLHLIQLGLFWPVLPAFSELV